MLYSKEEMIKDLALLVFLKQSISETEAFDGYTKEDQTEYFISRNGFEPSFELNNILEKLLVKYCNKAIIEEIKHYHTSSELDLDRLSKLQNEVNNFTLDKLHKRIIFELFSTKK